MEMRHDARMPLAWNAVWIRLKPIVEGKRNKKITFETTMDLEALFNDLKTCFGFSVEDVVVNGENMTDRYFHFLKTNEV